MIEQTKQQPTSVVKQPRLIFFGRHCAIFFTNAGRYYFFTVEDAFLFGVAVKFIVQVGQVFSFELNRSCVSDMCDPTYQLLHFQLPLTLCILIFIYSPHVVFGFLSACYRSSPQGQLIFISSMWNFLYNLCSGVYQLILECQIKGFQFVEEGTEK